MFIKCIVIIVVVLVCVLLIVLAAGKMEMFCFYFKMQLFVFMYVDGIVVDYLLFLEAKFGDWFDIYVVDYKGDYKCYVKVLFGSEYVVCMFFVVFELDCVLYVVIGGSLLIFRGFFGSVIGGAGCYLGVIGCVLFSKEVEGGFDVVVRICLVLVFIF